MTHRAKSKRPEIDIALEYACHEGNYSMRNILEAARANDATPPTKTPPSSR
jgi:hypothetical protein